MHAATLSYANAHRGRLVPGAADLLANLHRWHGARDAAGDAFDPTRGPLWAYLETAEVKRCPSFDDGNDGGFEAGTGGYGYNNEYAGRADRGDYGETVGARLPWFADPAGTALFADAALMISGGKLIEYGFIEPPNFAYGDVEYDASPSTHFRHDGRASVARLDGHVSAETMSFTRANAYGNSAELLERAALGWFGPRDNSLFDRR